MWMCRKKNWKTVFYMAILMACSASSAQSSGGWISRYFTHDSDSTGKVTTDKASDAADKAMDAVNETATDAMDKASDAADKAMDAVNETATDAADKASDAADKAMDAVNETATDAMDKASDAADK
ncbi:cytoskeletal protein RodZ, partial [Bartonella silvatica]